MLSRSESRCTVRISVTSCPTASDVLADNLSSLSALITALADLDALCVTIEEKYVESLKEDKYERWDERS